MEKVGPEGDVILIGSNLIPLDMVGVTEEEVDDSESDMDDEDIVVDDETDEEASNDDGLNVK